MNDKNVWVPNDIDSDVAARLEALANQTGRQLHRGPVPDDAKDVQMFDDVASLQEQLLALTSDSDEDAVVVDSKPHPDGPRAKRRGRKS